MRSLRTGKTAYELFFLILRSLDALHLGGFKLIADEHWNLVTSDGTMERFGKLMGFSVFNPLA